MFQFRSSLMSLFQPAISNRMINLFSQWLSEYLSDSTSQVAVQLNATVGQAEIPITPENLVDHLKSHKTTEPVLQLAEELIARWRLESATDANLLILIEDIRQVLSYTATEGVTVDQHLTNELLTNINKIEEGDRSAEVQAMLYTASQTLHRSIAPINADGIRRWTNKKHYLRSVKDFFTSKPQQATNSGTKYYTAALYTLIIFAVILHIYLLVLQHSSKTLESDIAQLTELQAVETTTLNPQSTTGDLATENTLSINHLYTIEHYCRIQSRWEYHLENTNRVIQNPLGILKKSSNNDKSHSTNECIDFLSDADATPARWLDVTLLDPDSALTRAQSIITSITALALPFFYASMGALIYILRMISGELDAMRYSRARVMQYKLRLPMGIVAGVSIGFLFHPDTYNSLSSSLTPLGVAFIAGYSVDLLFNLIDRVVGAFVDDRDKKAHTAPPGGTLEPTGSSAKQQINNPPQ